MDSEQRRQAIRSILAVRNSIRVSQLSERLDVSEVTIRKDLAILEEQGYVQRTYGGAVRAELPGVMPSLSARRAADPEVKAALAAAAKELITHGETIYLDSGSTCAALAEKIREMELRVVTNSVEAMAALVDRPNIALHVTGGSYRHDAGSLIGPWAEEALGKIQVDHAFMGTTGISTDGRLSSHNSLESQVKRKAIAAARSTVVLCDRTKLGQQTFSVFAEAHDIDVLISNASPEDLEPYEELGIHCIPISTTSSFVETQGEYS